MLKILFLGFIFIGLFLIRRALIPVAIGIAIAYILDPFVDRLSKKLGGHRLLAVIASYFIVLAAMALLVLGFADMIAGKMSTGSLQEALGTLNLYYQDYKDVLTELFGFSMKTPDLSKLVQSIGGGTVKFLIGAVAGIYLLNDKAFFLRLGTQAMHLIFGQRMHGKVREVLFDIHEVVSAFLRGVFVDSVIVAFLASFALSFLGVEFSVFIGCFAGIANVIPYFGPVIGMIPAVISALTTGGLSLAVMAALVLLTIQQVECNFIYPRIIGKSTGLHPLFVLAAVSVAGSIGGIFWMVLAVPIAGIIRVLLLKWAEEQ